MTGNLDKLLDQTTLTAWIGLHRSSTALLAEVETRLKAKGLPPLGWYDVLLELRKAEGQALRPVEIEKRTLLAQYNLSRLIDRLVSAGLVEKNKAELDGRGVLVCLTGKGEQVLEEMWPVYAAAIRTRFEKQLPQEDLADLTRILEKLHA
jgi:DNA-binding MarR family transcriptional regulator